MGFGKNLSSAPALLFIVLISILFFEASARGAIENARDPGILWAFGAMRALSAHPRAVPVTSDMVLHSGDKLKMMIRIRKKCFVYLIHKDSQGHFTMLFPYSPGQFDTDYRIGQNYYAPQGDAWFQLDKKTGKETFYLIASDQRLRDIEYTYARYASCQGGKDKQDLAGQMLSELDGIARKHFASSSRAGLSADQATLARGFERAAGEDPTDITGLARKIDFNNVYSKTYVIEHE